MPSIINTNMMSLNSQRHLNTTQSALAGAMERLSSGKRINSAKDDAAGLGISERMTSQINGMNQAIRNANDGISLGQTAEGALGTMNDMLQRVRVLAVQSSNATNSPSDRQALQNEVGQLVSELNRIAEVTTFNGQFLLNGTMGTQYFQVGANAGEVLGANGTNFTTGTYGNFRVGQDGVLPMAAPVTKSGGDVKITGYVGTADLNITASDTARTLVGKINNLSGDTGVTASARTDAFLELDAGDTYALNLVSNNATPVTVSFAVGSDVSLSDSFAAAINAINSQTAKTGVTAEYDVANQGIRLTNADGNDITLANTITANTATIMGYEADRSTLITGAAASISTATGATAFGTVTLDSPNSFVVEDDPTGSTEYPLDGTGTLMPVSSLDVSTFDDAQKAIQIVDSALVHIVGEMARYGALQARFEATISNLERTSENTTNSRSRIQDADYAQETAALSKATILQQAGISMLAQANQVPQTVLNLLQ